MVVSGPWAGELPPGQRRSTERRLKSGDWTTCSEAEGRVGGEVRGPQLIPPTAPRQAVLVVMQPPAPAPWSTKLPFPAIPPAIHEEAEEAAAAAAADAPP